MANKWRGKTYAPGLKPLADNLKAKHTATQARRKTEELDYHHNHAQAEARECAQRQRDKLARRAARAGHKTEKSQ